MKKSTSSETTGGEAGSQAGDLLARVEKAASAVVQQVKRVRVAADREGDALGAHAAFKNLREQLAALKELAEDIANSERPYADRADKQFLELESMIREACGMRAWRVDGQWPTLYVERAIIVEVSEAKRSVTVAGRKLPGATAQALVSALDPLVRELLPREFAPREFMRDLAAAYDSIRGEASQLPVFDLYRGFVVRSQRARFWRDARAEAFTALSLDQFRARLTGTFEGGVTSAPDGRELRLLPPLNPKDGLFMYQPAESRYGFVGRVEFVSPFSSEAP